MPNKDGRGPVWLNQDAKRGFGHGRRSGFHAASHGRRGACGRCRARGVAISDTEAKEADNPPREL